MIRGYKPHLAVELGVLHGYSTLAILEGMKANCHGELHSYDLFEDYPFNHGSMEEVRARIEAAGYPCCGVNYQLRKMDAFMVHELYPENSVGFLHVDLSNDGDIVRRIMELWDPKMVYGGIICFEGGTEERDRVEWMVKYGNAAMKPELEKNKIIEDKYVMGTYLEFPGLTVLLKKR